MKNLLSFSAALMLAVFVLSSCSPYNSCDKWRMGIFSRGEGDAPFAPGTGKDLSKTKADAQCVVTVYNKVDKDVNVFIDTVWQGSLKANSKGYVNIEDGEFQYLHAITADSELGWSAQGDCAGKKDFKLSNK